MTHKSTIIFVFSLLVAADAGKITFSKINGKIYVETDPFHYAMFGPVKDKDGLRIVAINGNDHYHQTSKCNDVKTSLLGLKDKQQEQYRQVRDAFLEETRECPAISGTPTKGYIWSGTYFSDETPEYSAVRLDDETVVYSSQYFPKNLARVIISRYKVIFIHYDDDVIMKDLACLYINEKILIDGIRKIDVDRKRNSLIYPKGENALKKHLKSHPIDEANFRNEQEYIKTLTDKDYAAIEQVLREGAFKSFDNWVVTVGVGKGIRY